MKENFQFKWINELTKLDTVSEKNNLLLIAERFVRDLESFELRHDLYDFPFQ